MMASLERAIEIAATAHAGQLDRSGQPYVLHPLRVMLAVNSEHERMAAVMHDVVEDSAITYDDLINEGFPTEVVEAVRLLTRAKGASRIDAARKAVRNPVARAVKLADVIDNSDLTRIPSPSEKDLARQREYQQVREILEAG